jgi:ribonuclease I
MACSIPHPRSSRRRAATSRALVPGVLVPIALVLGALAAPPARAAPLSPARHGDFGHYTFALTWQPGFCGTDGGCLRDQPRDVLIGLHGLWASRPRSLIERGVSAPQWWRRGCDYYHHSGRAPRLPPAMLRRLRRVMPHLRHGLLRHEYDKHVQCFGFDPRAFFATEMRMRRRVVHSAFGRYLTAGARGQEVRHADVSRAFMRAFATDRARALQLRCARDRRGREVLTQLWITLRPDATARFPRDGALMSAPIAQDNCPGRFRVPRWR